jgi:TolB-like protein/Flp pilus assembly protein TadD
MSDKPSFFAELKRRNVLRAGVLYIGALWALAQGISQLGPAFGAPGWFTRWFVIAGVIGFPFAMFFSWFHEWTLHGLKRESNASANAGRLWPDREQAAPGTAGTIANANTRSADTARIDSIAVLPFQMRNSDADTEYLSDGLAESLIYRLSRLSGLSVSPTSSVQRYRNAMADPLQAGRDLGVSAVMTGRFAQRADSLVVSVELLDVRNERLLWGERYDRKLADLLVTQREIAAEIIQNLKPELSAPDRASLSKQYTDNNEAYQLYLKGKYHYAKRTLDGIERGIECFRQAIALDPQFALAHVGLADSYISLPAFSYRPSHATYPLAIGSARRALEIDPSLGEAHAALAISLATHDWNWVEAEREFKLALEFAPRAADTHFRYAMTFLGPMGRTLEAVAELEQALELEPLALIIGTNLTLAYIYARQYDRALDQARKTHALDPGFMVGRVALGFAYNANAMYPEAIALIETEPKNSPAYRWFLIFAGYALAKLNRMDEARATVALYAELAKGHYVSSYYLAILYAALDDREAAFAALEQACAERDFFVARLNVDPFLDNLHDDPRLADLARRIGVVKAP